MSLQHPRTIPNSTFRMNIKFSHLFFSFSCVADENINKKMFVLPMFKNVVVKGIFADLAE